MSQVLFTCIAAALPATVLGLPAQAQQRPQIETKKVDGTDNVYIFRNGNHQSMFIVTKDGVIATDPIAYGRPTGGQHYVDEIKKVTDKPIKYPDLQPPSLRPHRRRQGVQGRRAPRIIAHKNVKAASRAARRSEHRAAGRGVRRQEDDQARRHHARSCSISAPTTPISTS